MAQSTSWEADSLSTGQGIPHSLRKPKVYYLGHKIPPLDTILTQLNSIHTHIFF